MFNYLETTADLGVEAKGKSLEEAFKEGAKGLYNIMVDIDKVDKREKVEFEVEGELRRVFRVLGLLLLSLIDLMLKGQLLFSCLLHLLRTGLLLI